MDRLKIMEYVNSTIIPNKNDNFYALKNYIMFEIIRNKDNEKLDNLIQYIIFLELYIANEKMKESKNEL